MTIDELKAEAKAHGYNLVPIKVTEKLMPCTCGSRRREHRQRWRGDGWTFILQCRRCGIKVEGSTEAEVRHNWNEAIKADRETENSSEKPNNSKDEPQDCLTCRYNSDEWDSPKCDGCSKAHSNYEPQTDCPWR